MNNSPEELIKVGDVILSRDAVEQLEELQQNQNEQINVWRDSFADAISVIIELASKESNSIDNHTKLLTRLAKHRKDIIYLAKPYN